MLIKKIKGLVDHGYLTAMMMNKPPFLIKCYCGGLMKLTTLKSAGKIQLQQYECPVCKDQLSLSQLPDGD